MYQVNLKFNDLSEIVNFCDKKGDIMVKSTESTSVFDTIIVNNDTPVRSYTSKKKRNAWWYLKRVTYSRVPNKRMGH